MSDEKEMGYWTSKDMNQLMTEYIESFKFLHPNHIMLCNVDWSSNHSAMSPDARTLSNMRVRYGSQRKRNGEVESMPTFKPWTLTQDDIGPNVPPEWRQRVQVGKSFEFKFKGREVLFYVLAEGMMAKDVRGQCIGKRKLS